MTQKPPHEIGGGFYFVVVQCLVSIVIKHAPTILLLHNALK